MKRGVVILYIAMILAASALVSGAACDLSVNILNQDPYPAAPGEYVKVVFQINGTSNPECGTIYFNVLPTYPFSVDSSEQRFVARGNTFLSGYSSYLLKGYTIRVDKNAIDGDNAIKVEYGYQSDGTSGSYTKENLDINVKDARADFEVSVQGYDAAKNTVTFGIINVGKYDIESLTLEIPDQDNIKPRGSNVAIIGSLNSNDDTTVNVDAVPKVGEITMILNYNDQNDVRRVVEKKVSFTSNFVENGTVKEARDKYFYLFWGLAVLLVLWWIYGYYKRRKAKTSKLALLKRG